jgi:hypothetical protein
VPSAGLPIEENDFVGNDFVEILWLRLCRAGFFAAEN